MFNENKKIDDAENEENLLEFLSRSGLDAIMPFLDRSDDKPRHCDFELEDDDSLVHEAFPKGT